VEDAAHIRLQLHSLYKNCHRLARGEVSSINNTKPLDLNIATFVGIDAHPSTHTALAINRFEEEKGQIRFANTPEGIRAFLTWLRSVAPDAQNTILGVEGGSTSRNALLSRLLADYPHVHEVNPVYTRQQRNAETRGDKSDSIDAKLIAEVLTKKLAQLPRITPTELSPRMLCLKKLVGYYEEQTAQGTRLQNQLSQLQREHTLSGEPQEKSALTCVIRGKKRELLHVRTAQKTLTAQMSKLLAEYGGNLTTIPGISTVLAAKLVAHSSGARRFANRDKYIRYSGIAPLERSSGKYHRFAKGKRGNRQLHGTFYLAALLQIQNNQRAKIYFEKKLSEGKTKQQALVCVMKRTACLVYGMLKSGEAYRSPT